MSSIKIALCDDEPSWLAREEALLSGFAKNRGHSFDIRSYTTATALFSDKDFAPDVLFSDIELGSQYSGVDLARYVTRIWPSCQLVYVTNHLRYASDVYETSHLWFVLKDELSTRLPTIMEKLQQQMEDGSKALAVETVKHELVAIPCAQIVSLERKARVTTIEVQTGEAYQVPERLALLLARLPERLFARCHGSFAVGLAHVRLVRKDAIVVDTGTEVPLSRRYAGSFRERYLDWAESHAL